MTTDPQIVTPIIDEPEFTSAQIAQDISASYDSATLIARLVTENVHSDENHNTVIRNINHLKSCLTLRRIIDNASNSDMTAFADVVERGENWIA
jgi:hypothetical protein